MGGFHNFVFFEGAHGKIVLFLVHREALTRGGTGRLFFRLIYIIYRPGRARVYRCVRV